jgi:hypothetical protein
VRAIGATSQLELVPGPPARVRDVRLTYAAGRWSGPHSLAADGRVTVPAGATLALRNQTNGFVLALLENLERTRDATSLADVSGLEEFDDVLKTDSSVPAFGRQPS